MLPFAALSRRALVAVTALGAVASTATAKKKKPKQPLAFALVTPKDVEVASAADGKFLFHFEWGLVYPAGPYALTTNGDSMSLAAPATKAQARAAIEAHVRSRASYNLAFAGFTVPKYRIAAVLL